MTMLLIDSDSEKSYARRKMPVLPAMANAENMPYRPRRLHLVLGPEGYGFLLRQEKTGTGRSGERQTHSLPCTHTLAYSHTNELQTVYLCLVYTVHMVREVDKGSPAELGSVKEGEMLLEVNGESTESLSHNQVVSKIRQSGPQVTLTTMPPLGQDFYNKVNIQSEHINTNTGMILQLRHFLKNNFSKVKKKIVIEI